MNTNKYFMNVDNRNSRILKPWVIFVALMVCLAGSIMLHGWSQAGRISPAIQVLLGTAQGSSGSVISQDNVTVFMPPNATNVDGTISIALADSDLALVSDGAPWIRPIVVNVEFHGPDGAPASDISFFYPLEVCFTLTEEQWQALTQDPRLFQVQIYAENKNPPRWEVLTQTTYPERLQLCGKSYQTSLFSLAVKPEAPIPVTGPTETATQTLIPTRTRVPAIQTQERRRRDVLTAAAPQSSPTSQSFIQPFSTNPQPTDPPILQPTSTRPPTLQPTSTRRPTSTPRPPTRAPTQAPTNPPATATRPPPTPTNPPATATNPPPTLPPPTATDPPPTPVPPTDVPPTFTSEPPTSEPEPTATEEPTEEPTPEPPPPPEEPTEPAPTEPGLVGFLRWLLSFS